MSSLSSLTNTITLTFKYQFFRAPRHHHRKLPQTSFLVRSVRPPVLNRNFNFNFNFNSSTDPACLTKALLSEDSVHQKLTPDSSKFVASRGTATARVISRGAMVVATAAEPAAAVAGKDDGLPATELGYFDDMFLLQSRATFLDLRTEGDRSAVIVNNTILYPQGGGQPADTGSISSLDGKVNFQVEDVRARNGLVYHYGSFQSTEDAPFQKGQEVVLTVDADRRVHNSRLHTAGHLLDACMHKVGLPMEPGKGHHFPDSPHVEYKGTIPAPAIQAKRAELEAEANRLIKQGGPVRVLVAPYDEAADLCGGRLPDYIAKGSSPRIVTVAGFGCPCGGTHVADVTEIGGVKVPQIRVKKGVTKVSYNVTGESQ